MARRPRQDADDDTSAPDRRRGADLRRRLRVAAVLTVPVLAPVDGPGAAVHAAGSGSSLRSRCPSSPGRRGRSTAPPSARPGTARRRWTRSSRSAIVAATGWSLWALLFGGAGELGMSHDPVAVAPRASAAMATAVPELYFEVAAVVTTFLLAGRYAEHRSRRRAGDALRALLDLGAKDVALVVARADGRRTERGCRSTALAVGDEFVVRPGEKVATDGVVVSGTRALDTSLLTGEPVPGRRRPRRRGHRRDRQHVRRTSSCAPRASARRPGWRRSAAWSPRADRQGAGAAAGRPHLRGVRAGRPRPRARHAGRVAATGRAAPRRRSPPRSRC